MGEVQQVHPEKGGQEETRHLISIAFIGNHRIVFYYRNLMQQKIEAFDSPPPNYSLNKHARHGFSHRPSPAQIAAYLIIASSIAIYFSSTLALYFSNALLVLYLLFGLAMVVSTALATLNDPTDRVVYYYMWSRHDRKVTFAPEYDKVLFCEFCESYCGMSSKHCRNCNRCVDNFDHHCMWFNNCVGQRNYRLFLASIFSTFAYTLVVVIHVALASFSANFMDSSQLLRIVLSWIIGLVLGVFGFLIFNLILLHIYLLATDQTTYGFLQRKKREEEMQRKEKERQKAALTKKEEIKEGSSNQIICIQGVVHVQSSEESIANTKIIMVQNQRRQEQEKPDFNRKVSNDYFQQQLAKHSKKSDDDNTVKSKQEQNQAELTLQQENQLNLQQSQEMLPNFLRKNRSLKLLLSSSEASRPSRRKMHTNME